MSGADRVKSLDLRDEPAKSQYEGWHDGQLAGYVQYNRLDGSVALMHTQVTEAFEGRGVGGVLARAVLDDIRAKGHTVRPYCPFLKGWIDKHPEYQDLLAADTPAG
ncbi:GNAT family N-acetyltransferase [Actinokineospora iranica]|uniref:Uncharacterized protein n=1 Tax=Actinokineospora iranica TaxID=1271860 RepID=A0A1G6NAC1_9PSEU|nr:GNAT family N-acetyltransferase [Actinokineospora iranica]SDC64759.1 hypothetical protein SAMN05216174_103269 [Actinokineospora iranica]